MDITDLSIGLRIEGSNALSSRCTSRFLEVRAQALPTTIGFIGNPIVGIDALGFVADFVLAVEVLESGSEAV